MAEWIGEATHSALAAAFRRHLAAPAAVEVEAVFVAGFEDIAEFSRLAASFASRGAYAQSLSLDVAHRNVRATMTGADAIREYCELGGAAFPRGTEFVAKKLLERVPVDDFRFRVNAKTETPLDPADAPRRPPAGASCRLKKRVSFDLPRHGCRLDLTAVRETRNAWRPSPDATERYEVEVEVVGSRADPDAALAGFLDAVREVLVVRQRTPTRPLGVSTTFRVLRSYMLMVGLGDDVERALRTPRAFFVGPQPVTLELKDVAGVLRDGYTVTEKADGERRLVYVDAVGNAYAISNRLGIVDLGASAPEASSTLLDCEMLEDPDAMLLAFDAYYFRGEPVFMRPLVDDRIAALQEAVAALAPRVRGFLVAAKRFAHGKDLHTAVAQVLDAPYVYQTDGLILTPANLGVGASEGDPDSGAVGDPPRLAPGAWRSVFKWKPVNTIDFLVRDTGVVREVPGRGPCRTFTLLVARDRAASVSRSERLRAVAVLSGRGADAAPPEPTAAVPFVVPEDPSTERMHVPLNANGSPACRGDGSVVRDDTIVECAWEAGAWVADRVRADKTEAYRRSGRVAGAANSMATAMNAWTSIREPVTEGMMRGTEAVPRPERADAGAVAYYARKDVAREDSATFGMRDFNGRWVKGRLYACFRGARRIFEFACGRANDINRWLAMPALRDVMGVDVDADNIEDPVDGAYARVRGRAAARLAKNAVFLVADASRPLDEDAFEAQRDPGERDLCRVLWALDPVPPPAGDPLARFYGFARDPFDVVSCQYAVHYFFASEGTLDAFVGNVARQLAPGGYFVGTCFDADAVHAALGDADAVSGTSRDGDLVFEIRRGYKGAPGGVGKRITVYVESINRRIDEYLVDFRVLDAKLAAHGIRPLTADEAKEIGFGAGANGRVAFRDEFEALLAAEPAVRRSFVRAVEMSAAERQFSFLNCAFAYRRRLVKS